MAEAGENARIYELSETNEKKKHVAHPIDPI